MQLPELHSSSGNRRWPSERPRQRDGDAMGTAGLPSARDDTPSYGTTNQPGYSIFAGQLRLWFVVAVIFCSIFLRPTSTAQGQNTYLANAETLIAFACDEARVDEAKAQGGVLSPFGKYRDVEFTRIKTIDREVVFAPHAEKRFFVLGSIFNSRSAVPIVGTIGTVTMDSLRNLLGEPRSVKDDRSEYAGETSSIDVYEKEGRVVRIIVSCGSFVF